MNLIDVLGLDPNRVEWQDLGLCNGMDRDWFFERYENDEVHRQNVDLMCEDCPVRQDCLRFGLENKEMGVWGGFYLDGKGGIDKTKIGHKSDEVKERLRGL